MPLRSWPARAFGSALFLVLAILTASAHAGPEDPPPATIAWSAPAECPGRAEVERHVSERLPPDASIAARGRVERVRDGYRLVLEIASRGERILEATTCESLVSSAAIVIAMSYAPSPAPTPAPSKPAENAVPPADRVEPPRAAERERRFGARVEATGDVGMLPSPAAGIGAAVGIDPVSRLHVEAFGGGFFSQDATALEGPARGASLTLLAAGLRGCFALTRGIEIAPCLGAEILHLSASGYGSVRVADASSTTWAPEASVGLRVPIAGPLFVRAGAGAFLPMSRQTFVITAVGSVHRPDAVAVRAFIGPELRF